MDSRVKMLAATLLAVTVIGCAGVKTFTDINVQEGQTVAIAIGQKKYFTQDDMTVTVTPPSGPPVVINAPNPAIRAVINLYPDDLSSLKVSDEMNFDITSGAQSYSNQIKTNFSGGGKNYWQTVVFFDMPNIGGVTGLTTIGLTNSHSETASSTVNVIAGTGTKHGFDGVGTGPLSAGQIESMERLDHYEVDFNYSGSPVPHAVELELAYTNTLLGHIINQTGTVKNVYWNDTGSGYKVILLPANDPLEDINDFNFEVAIGFGFDGLTTLEVTPGSVKGYDINGNPIAGVSATTNLVYGTAGLF